MIIYDLHPPPYGDHITYIVVQAATHMFSPPYGDYIEQIGV